jgi:SET domain-containing protein
MGYYDKEIKELRDAVSGCHSYVPRKMYYFLHEANTHSSGIPTDIVKEIENLANEFESNCYCNKNESEPSTYRGYPYSSKTRVIHGRAAKDQ